MPNPNLNIRQTDTGTGNNSYAVTKSNGVAKAYNKLTGNSVYGTVDSKGNVTYSPTNQEKAKDIYTGNTGSTPDTGNNGSALDDSAFANWYANFLKSNQFDATPYQKLLNAQKINSDNAVNTSYRKGMKNIGDMAKKMKTGALTSMATLASNRAQNLANNENTYNSGLSDLETLKQNNETNWRNTVLGMDTDSLKKIYKYL